MPNFCRVVFFIISCSLSWHAHAVTGGQIPAPLQPWVGWVLGENTDVSCPFLYNNFEQKHCSWPGPLILDLAARQGRFSSSWTLYRGDWVELPGDSHFWPQQVTVNGKPALVLNRKGKPAVYLAEGAYRIAGQFLWDRIPDNLAIPERTGLFSLTIDGKNVAFPNRKNDSVWLLDNETGRKTKPGSQNRLDLQVFRKVYDDVPLQLISVLELEVSGEQREISLPHALLASFIPISLNSPLPARIETDGSLLIQVRPGRWQIEIKARYPGPADKIDFAVSDDSWPETEVWAFQGQPHLRLVEIDNLPSVDPSQTNLPAAWRSLPAYQLKQGDSMLFKVIRRGDPEPEPSQLSLKRRLWLDFDGKGYTVNDQISGKMTRGWRLDVLPEMQLGQVQLNGDNQLITRLPETTAEGVEVRQGALQLSADSRIEGGISHLSAVGWQQDFYQVNAELNIPPGWRLLAAGGVDNEPDSWLARWTLLDFFLVLIAALAVSRLWNFSWGVFALFSLVLIWHEADAPRFVWLNILAAIALLRVLPAGRVRQLVRGYRNVSWLALVVIVIPFMVAQIRIGLYPQLEQPWQAITAPTYAGSDAPLSIAESRVAAESVPTRSMAKMRQAPESSYGYQQDTAAIDFNRIDPEAKIQTGPGLPQWQWQKIMLRWNGRVDPAQQLEFWYLSPRISLLLNFARVILVLALCLLVFGMLGKKFKLSLPVWSLLLLVSVPGMVLKPAHAGFPSEKMLQELKSRLLKAPECAPDCAQISAMHVTARPHDLAIRLQIHLQQDSAVPLPARDKQWYPNQVLVDGQTAQALLRDRSGQLWLGMTGGVHEVELHGLNPPFDQFTLPLPLQPHRVEQDVQGWHVAGVYGNGRVDHQLQFTRLESGKTQQESMTLRQTALPPFIRIEKTLHLGLDWRIDTRVTRVEQTEVPVTLDVPLLPGESVTSVDVRVNNRRVAVNMPAAQKFLSWQSALEKTDLIELQAAENNLWTEVWKADVSPIWHLETEGSIAAIHHQDQQGRWLPEWRPWPGEKVGLRIFRPEAVSGETLTVDKSELQIKPGKRTEEAELNIQIRSSNGSQHTVLIPDRAVLQAVLIDGVTQPIRQNGPSVTLPVRPGEQRISLKWHENKAQQNWLTTPQINLGIASVNSHIQVISGTDRWVLLTFGPKFGPAALIWGVLIVLALLAAGLGRIRLAPLKHWQWFLLLVGLSQIPLAAGILVVAWLIALGYRSRLTLENAVHFNILQVVLAALTVVSLLLLFFAVQQGLLGSPDMQIAGNHSSAYRLNWYQDRNAAWLPTATVISVPMLVYRILMLLWSLWLAVSLLNWLKWGWQCVSRDGLWKKREAKTKTLAAKESET